MTEKCLNILDALKDLPDEVFSKSQRLNAFKKLESMSKDKDFKDKASKYADDLAEQLEPKLKSRYRSQLASRRAYENQSSIQKTYQSQKRFFGDMLQKVQRRISAMAFANMNELRETLDTIDPLAIDFCQHEKNEEHVINAADAHFGKILGQTKIPEAAKQFIKALVDLNDKVYNRALELGVNANKLSDWLTFQSHNPTKIRMAFESSLDSSRERWNMIKSGIPISKVNSHMRDLARKNWVLFTKDRLDLARTFGEKQKDGTYKLSMSDKEIEDELSNNWHEITGGKLRVDEIGQNADELRRVYHYKDKRSWQEYNSKYGSGSFYQALLDGVHRNSRRLATVEELGPRPYSVFKKLSDDAVELTKGPGKENVTYNDINNKYLHKLDSLLGNKNLPEPHIADRIASAVDQLNFVTKLAKSGIKSAQDINFMMLTLRNTGMPYYKRIGYSLGTLEHFIPGGIGPRKWFRDQISLDGHSLGMQGYNRYGGVQDGLWAKYVHLYFRLNFQHAVDEGLRTRTTQIYSGLYYKHLSQSYENMTPEFKNLVNSFGLGEKEHILFQENKDAFKVYRNKRYVTPKGITQFDHDSLDRYAGKKLTDKQRQDVIDDLKLKLTDMYVEQANNVQINPNELDRASIGIMDNANPYVRAIAKMGLNLKWFGISSSRRVMNKLFLEGNRMSMSEAFWKPSSAHLYLLQHIFTTMITGLAADEAASLITSGTFFNPTDHPVRTFFQSLAGIFGLVGTVIYPMTNNRPISLDDFFNSGGLGTMLDTLNLAKQLVTFDSEGKRINYHDRVMKAALNFSNRHMIFHLPLTEGAYHRFVFDPLMNNVDPDYLWRQQERERRENPGDIHFNPLGIFD